MLQISLLLIKTVDQQHAGQYSPDRQNFNIM